MPEVELFDLGGDKQAFFTLYQKKVKAGEVVVWEKWAIFFTLEENRATPEDARPQSGHETTVAAGHKHPIPIIHINPGPEYADANRNSPPAILPRESWREGKKTKKRTIANLTNWPAALVESFRKILLGAVAVYPRDVFSIKRSLPHGHVKAILGMMLKLELDNIIASKPCRERDLVLGMIAEQIIHPTSKPGFARIWNTTTLPEELDIKDADENDLYSAMDWLYERQERIEKKLAGRHLHDRAQVLYDVTSSYFEGNICPLAQFGYNRDGKAGI